MLAGAASQRRQKRNEGGQHDGTSAAVAAVARRQRQRQHGNGGGVGVVWRRCGGGAGLEATAAAAWQRPWQCGGRCGDGSAAVAAATVAAWWQQPAWRRRWQLGGSVTLEAAAALEEAWRQLCGGSGSSAVAGSLATVVAAWRQQLGSSAAAAVAAAEGGPAQSFPSIFFLVGGLNF